MTNYIMKLIDWIFKKQNAWYVNPYTRDKEGYYIDSLQDIEYLDDKLHYGAVAIKIDFWD